ncbi:MAG TPA: hypothetical protein VFS54_08585 [Solirubrobacterales bacterium]|nr:hypothetical protein [Solirubrobacterales bacterium]
MKRTKYLGASAALVIAMLVLVSSVSATSITKTTGGAASTPTFHVVNEGGHITLANPIANVSCSVTLQGTIEGHGSGIAASGKLSTLNITGCTNSWHVTSINNGSLSVNYISGHNGAAVSTGARIDATRLGVTCVYITSNTSLGTVTGGSPATGALAASIPISTTESSGLCGTGNAKLEGSAVGTGSAYVAP